MATQVTNGRQRAGNAPENNHLLTKRRIGVRELRILANTRSLGARLSRHELRILDNTRSFDARLSGHELRILVNTRNFLDGLLHAHPAPFATVWRASTCELRILTNIRNSQVGLSVAYYLGSFSECNQIASQISAICANKARRVCARRVGPCAFCPEMVQQPRPVPALPQPALHDAWPSANSSRPPGPTS